MKTQTPRVSDSVHLDHFLGATLGMRNKSEGQRHWAEPRPPLCIHSAFDTGNRFLSQGQEMHFSLAVVRPFVPRLLDVYSLQS